MQVKKGWKMAAMSAALTGAVALIPMGASAHSIDQPLQKGAHGKEVNPVQKQLKKLDYYKGQVDGIYGKNTKKALTQYQKDHDLATDGVYGTDTSNAMEQSKHTHKKLNNVSMLQQGSQGKAVKALQTKLQLLHYYNGNIDSIFGSQTKAATKALQNASNIAVDGIVGPNTKNALENDPMSAKAVNHQSSQDTSKQKPATHKKAEQNGNSNPQTKTQPTQKKANKTTVQHNPTNQAEANDTNNASHKSNNNQSNEQTQQRTSSNNQNNNQQTEKRHNQANKSTTQQNQASQAQNHDENQTKAANTSNSNNNTTQKSSSGKSISVEATAYSADCSGCSGTTSQGIDLKNNPNKKVIAVDPDVIEPGSTVQVPGYGKAVAGDTGGDIQGNRIDIYKSDKSEANSYGRKHITVKVLD